MAEVERLRARHGAAAAAPSLCTVPRVTPITAVGRNDDAVRVPVSHCLEGHGHDCTWIPPDKVAAAQVGAASRPRPFPHAFVAVTTPGGTRAAARAPGPSATVGIACDGAAGSGGGGRRDDFEGEGGMRRRNPLRPRRDDLGSDGGLWGEEAGWDRYRARRRRGRAARAGTRASGGRPRAGGAAAANARAGTRACIRPPSRGGVARAPISSAKGRPPPIRRIGAAAAAPCRGSAAAPPRATFHRQLRAPLDRRVAEQLPRGRVGAAGVARDGRAPRLATPPLPAALAAKGCQVQRRTGQSCGGLWRASGPGWRTGGPADPGRRTSADSGGLPAEWLAGSGGLADFGGLAGSPAAGSAAMLAALPPGAAATLPPRAVHRGRRRRLAGHQPPLLQVHQPLQLGADRVVLVLVVVDLHRLRGRPGSGSSGRTCARASHRNRLCKHTCLLECRARELGPGLVDLCIPAEWAGPLAAAPVPIAVAAN
eukprot:gene9415-biopygen11491